VKKKKTTADSQSHDILTVLSGSALLPWVLSAGCDRCFMEFKADFMLVNPDGKFSANRSNKLSLSE
jgi:hypothetical protein